MQKFLLILLFFVSITSTSFAAGFFSNTEADGCTKSDPFLPTLVICGRNPAAGVCPAYTQACTVGDLVETGRRGIIWIISIVLLILPVLIAWTGAQMIILREFKGAGIDIAKIKERILWMIIYFVCLLGAWIIMRTIVDIAQVRTDRINTFLIEKDGSRVKAREFNFSR